MNTHNAGRTFFASALILLLATTGCATKKPGEPLHTTTASSSYDDTAPKNNDPLEGLNRGIFRFNEVIDGVFLKPITHIYLGLMPEPGQRGLKNALTNLAAPVIFVNSVLQADAPNAERTFGRFVINSTIGIVGIFDVATPLGIQKEHRKDFGQTLGVYGVGPGPYLVLPILGPSNLRDSVGLIVDVFDDPFTYIFTVDETIIRDVARTIVARADIMPLTNRIDNDSFDPYATFRSIYQQHRVKVVHDYKVRDSGELQKETGK